MYWFKIYSLSSFYLQNPEEFNSWSDENDIATALTAAFYQTHAAAVTAARTKTVMQKATTLIGMPKQDKNSNKVKTQEVQQPVDEAQIEDGGEASGGLQRSTVGEDQMEAPGEMEHAADEGMQQTDGEWSTLAECELVFLICFILLVAPGEEISGLEQGLTLEKIYGDLQKETEYSWQMGMKESARVCSWEKCFEKCPKS